MTREGWDRYERVANKPDVILAMKARCEEQGHEYQPCCNMMLQVYYECKWCGTRK